MNVASKSDVQLSDEHSIPYAWSTASLREIASPSIAFSFRGGPFGSALKSDDYTTTGIRVLQLQDIGEGIFLNKSNVRTSESKANELLASNVYPGDILLAKMTPVARCCLVPNLEVRYLMCSDGIRLAVDETRFNKNYIFQALNGPEFRKVAESKSTGSTRGRIGLSELKSIHLPIPPLAEQQKIAAVLMAVDDKLAVITRQITATQTLKRGMMQTLFSRGAGKQYIDGRWAPHTIFKDSELGKIPASWDAKSLVKLAKESRKRNSGSLDDSLLCGVLKSQGLVPMRERVKGVSTERCRVVEPDAFAYNPMRINIGSIARNLSQRAVMVSPDYVVFSSIPSLLSADYLDHFRKSDGWTRFVGQSGDGGVRIRIYFDHLSHVLIPTPPMLEQKRIVEILNNIDGKINVLRDKQTYYQILKRGLMQKLLTGEWRVKLDDAALTD